MGDQEKIQGKKSNSNSKQVQVQTKMSETLCEALFNTIKNQKKLCEVLCKTKF